MGDSLLLVDDHQFVRIALKGMLSSSLSPLPHIDDVGTLKDAIEQVGTNTYSLVLLDLDLEDSVGTDTLAAFRHACPEASVAVMSGDCTPETMTGVLDMGATGYIVKSQPPDVIVAAIRLMLAGGMYVPPAVWFSSGSQLPSQPLDKATQTPASSTASVDLLAFRENLSPRLQEVLDLVAHGKSNKEIARTLGLSHGTVKNYVSAIFEKLQVPNRSSVICQLAAFAVKGNRAKAGD